MSRNAIGPTDNDEAPVLCPQGKSSSSRTIYKSSSSDFKLLKFFEDRHSMIITITMRVNRDGVKDLFDYESDKRRLICMNCLRKSYVFQLPHHPWKRVLNTRELFVQPHCAVLAWEQASY